MKTTRERKKLKKVKKRLDKEKQLCYNGQAVPRERQTQQGLRSDV